MKNVKPYQPVVLLLMLVVPAVLLVLMSPTWRSDSQNRADAPAAVQEPLRGVMPSEQQVNRQASSLGALMSSMEGTGAYLAGNFAPAANIVGVEQVAAVTAPALEDEVAPPESDDCKYCPDRPRRTRTPRPNGGEPTQTPVIQPTETPIVEPTETPVPPPPPPPPTWTPVPATGTPVPNYHNPPADVVAVEAEVYQLINAHRLSLGKNAWNRIGALDLAQRDWAVQMVTNNECYHGDYGSRAYGQGYTGWAWGEVGACGYPTAQEAFQGWLDSPGHRGIIEAGIDMEDVGIGAWRYPNGYYSVWALVGSAD